ncbi:MAG: hypothetical protein LBC97_12615 [Bifidobacteriaceae bacterium]|nr:hypothetical protein [Bifidobacteriaceae bacterium]
MSRPNPAPPRIVVAAPFDPAAVGALAGRAEIVFAPPVREPIALAAGPHAPLLAEAAALVTELDLVDQSSLAAAPKLELLVVCRSDPKTADLAAARRRGIAVKTTPGRNAAATADLTLALILAVARQVGASERWLRAGSWRPEAQHWPYHHFQGLTLEGAVAGVVGYGQVGRKVARRLTGFGARVLVAAPRLAAEALDPGLTLVPLDDLLARSQVVTLHAPARADTAGMIGTRELARLPAGAVLVNTARAALVEEPALRAALDSGRLAGAGLDVFWQEPVPPDHWVLTHPAVAITPHIGGASPQVVRRQSELAAAHLADWLNRRDHFGKDEGETL